MEMMELCGAVSRESILTSWPVTLTGDSRRRRAAAAEVQSVGCANGCENGMSKIREGGLIIRTPVQVFAAKVAPISPRRFVLSMMEA